jgi:hypothetical protein
MKPHPPAQIPAYYVPAQFNLPAALATALAEAAVKSLRATAKLAPSARASLRGATLKPGRTTPLWNELAAAVQTQLARRGEKARLARLLGLPRQRVHDLLRARKHLPDAERTLLLLIWLQARSEGRDLA